MKRYLGIGVALAVAGLLALPGGSVAGPRETGAARTYCQAERQASPSAFRRDYGRGAAAVGRCVSRNLARSGARCRRELQNRPSRFEGLYGGVDIAAVNRCVRDDLKVVTSPSY